MRFNRLDLNLLIALDAILLEGSISRAAERLHLSQPAMSGALARLREHFHDPLFVQVGRKLTRTPLAESLAEPVREILMRVDAAVSMIPAFDPSSSDRRFSIIASDYIVAVLMDRVLARVYQEAPGISFQLYSTDKAVEMTERGEADLLMIPQQFALPEHPTEPTVDDSFTCVAWVHNTEVGETLTLAQYLSMGHVAAIQGPGRQPTLENFLLNQQCATRRIEVVTYNFTSLALLVIGTNRIATVHTRLAQQYAKQLPIRLIPLPVEFPWLQFVMQWHRHKSHDLGLAWLRQMVRKVAAEDPD